MRTPHTLAVLAAAALLLSACGDDGDGAADTVADVTTTIDAASTTAAADTVPAGTVTDDTVPPTAIDGPVQIDVRVGTDSGPDRVELVKLGSDVTLNITNPDAADEFHVHTIELEQEVDAGVTATFNFVADTPGTYEVESHVTEDVLVVIEVV